jgi:hypothetical protein
MPDTTRDSARAKLLEATAGVSDELTLAPAKAALTADLVTQVFDIAWERQFEERRRPVQTEMKRMIGLSVEAALLRADADKDEAQDSDS